MSKNISKNLSRLEEGGERKNKFANIRKVLQKCLTSIQISAIIIVASKGKQIATAS